MMKVTAPSDFDEESGEQDERGPWEMLGVPEPPFVDDALAPKVDRDFLARYVRGELPKPAADIAGRLVLLFAGWREAHKDSLADERARRKQ